MPSDNRLVLPTATTTAKPAVSAREPELASRALAQIQQCIEKSEDNRRTIASTGALTDEQEQRIRSEDEERFREREVHPLKHWKLSPIDRASIDRWDDYTRASQQMFNRTDTADAPWIIIKSDDKLRARLNAIRVLLHTVEYEDRDLKAVGEIDPLIVARASTVCEYGTYSSPNGDYYDDKKGKEKELHLKYKAFMKALQL